MLAALPVVCVLCLSPAADAAAPIQFPKKVRQEWELWGRAFQAAANEDGRITSRGVLDLFREHYKLIHNTIPGHESHDHITDEDAVSAGGACGAAESRQRLSAQALARTGAARGHILPHGALCRPT